MTWDIITTDKPTEEEAHEQLYAELETTVAKAYETLEVPHVLHVGLDYFIGLTYKCAPDKKTADLISLSWLCSPNLFSKCAFAL